MSICIGERIVTKNEAAKHCVECKKCQFEAIYDRGLTEENKDCPYAAFWVRPEKEEKPKAATKIYKCYYRSKFNNDLQDYYIEVEARTPKEAKDKCWQLVKQATGRHAFGIIPIATDKVPKYYSENTVNGYPPPKM